MTLRLFNCVVCGKPGGTFVTRTNLHQQKVYGHEVCFESAELAQGVDPQEVTMLVKSLVNEKA